MDEDLFVALSLAFYLDTTGHIESYQVRGRPSHLKRGPRSVKGSHTGRAVSLSEGALARTQRTRAMRPMRSFFFCESAYEYGLVYGYMSPGR